jgi:hypothetical protein
MGDDFADRLAREVPDWVEDGLVSDEQAHRILARYEGGDADRGLVQTLATGGFEATLYGIAAVLAGAAAIAFVLVGLDPPNAAPALAGIAVGAAGAGAALALLLDEAGPVADVMMAGAMAPAAAASFDPEPAGFIVSVPGLVLPLALLAWRWERSWVRHIAVVAFPVALGGSAHSHLATDEAAATVFLVVQALLLAGLVGRDRLLEGVDHPTTAALGVGGVAVATVTFLFEVADLGGSEEIELVLGAAMLLLIFAGILMAYRGLVVGAGVVLAGDAVVFAFDVGGTFGGTLLLLALAVLLVWQAETLRQAVG